MRLARALVVALLALGSLVPGARAQSAEPEPELTYVRATEIQPGAPFELIFRAVNNGAQAQGGSITIGIAGGHDLEIVNTSRLPGGDSYARIFEPGEQMFNFAQGRNAPISQRVAELYATTWPSGTIHQIRLRISSPGPITISARASMRRPGGPFVHSPRGGARDQQGAPAFVFDPYVRTTAPTQTPVVLVVTATPAPAPPTVVVAAPPTPVQPTSAPPTQPPPPTPAAAVATVPPVTVAPTNPPVTATPSATAGRQFPWLLVGGIASIGLGVTLAIVAIAYAVRSRARRATETAVPFVGLPTATPPPPSPVGTPRPPTPPWPGANVPTIPRGPLTPGPSTPHSDRYAERQLVGRGGMGAVYRARDSVLPRWVALKVMHPDLAARADFVERFRREAETAARLSGHPNIVTIYDVAHTGQELQIVMEWIDGTDLSRVIQNEAPMDPRRVVRIITPLCSALDYAHGQPQPVLHRDIKPANVMIGPDERVVLTDFGIAKLSGELTLTGTGQFVGTPEYMAPEVIQGRAGDHRADLYAVGVMIYQMLTGQLPFHAENQLGVLYKQVHTPPPSPRAVTPTVSLGIERVVMKALAKDPADRFPLGRHLAEALAAAVTDRN
jgi:predicted Ser/Thr protein kinase